MLNAADLLNQSASKILLRLMISRIINSTSPEPRSPMPNSSPSANHSAGTTEANLATSAPTKTTDAQVAGHGYDPSECVE